MFIVLSGYAPFASETNDIDELFDQILSGKVEFNEEYWSETSVEAKNLILSMLNIDIERRFTAEQVINHCWIKNDISTFTYEDRQASPLENDGQMYGHYTYLSEGSNLSSLYEEEQLNASNNLAAKLHHHNEAGLGAGYQHHHFKSNGQSNKSSHHANAVQTANNFNPIDHPNENGGNEPKLSNSSRIGKGHHLLLKNDASSDADSNSNSNTLIDSDVSNSSNSFASG